MKTAVRNTSIQAYHQLTEQNERSMAIIRHLEKVGSACNLDISDDLKLKINTVPALMGKMLEVGIIEEDRRDICPKTDRRVIYWRLSNRKMASEEIVQDVKSVLQKTFPKDFGNNEPKIDDKIVYKAEQLSIL